MRDDSLGRMTPWVAALLSLVLLGACRDKGARAAPEPGAALSDAGSDSAPEEHSNTEPPERPSLNPIPAENQLPGAPDWEDGEGSLHGEIDVYTSSESLAVGDTLGVKVSTNRQATPVTAEIFRIGDYGGAGARKVWSGGPWQVSPQPQCPRDPVTSRVECAWQDTFTVPIEASWVSGLYVVKIRRTDRFIRFAPFVVRDRRPAEILYTPNFTTYQAYNTWGGESLYSDNSKTMPNGRAWEVSFNRPYADTHGKGKTFHLDQYLVRFLEHHGYDVTYGTQLDFIRFPDMLKGISAFVHGGHDEYWPEQERDQLEAALATGKMSYAYFGANGGYWRIRLQPDAQGRALRTIACYKNEPQRDPVPFSTVRFRDPPKERAENNLFGSMYEGWLLFPYALAVHDPSHWLFEGTGVQPGTMFPGLVGYEYDKAFTDWPGYPQGVRISMKSAVVNAEGLPSYSHAVDRTLPSGRLVFSAGTIYWARGLADTSLGPRDPRVERMTLNVLERALEHRRPHRTLPPVTEALPTEPAPKGQWAHSVQAVAGQEAEAGWRDGPAEEARFESPTGLAVTREGHVVVADTRNNRIRLIQGGASGTVITLAGNGDLGYRDGEGSQAMFRTPTDVAVGPAGELYVADSGNHVIRRLDRTPTGWQVSTWAGQGFTAGFADGPGAQARFSRPLAIAVDPQGNLYVADQENHRIRKCLASTREVLTVAGNGDMGVDDAAQGTSASFAYPSALALGKQGELYVLDAASQHLRRISPNAQRSVLTIAGLGNDPAPIGFMDGAGTAAQFRAQLGMEVGLQGEVWLADTGNFRIRKVLPGTSPETTRVFTLAGSGRGGTALGPGDQADIVAPTGLARDEEGRLYVSDSFHHVIRLITP